MTHHHPETAACARIALEDIRRLFERQGAARYESGTSESVTQLEHALQCALLAESAGADEHLVSAALLHDVGHLLYTEDEFGSRRDDEHQNRALLLLAPLFPVPVLEPVRLHVQAKRYLCLIESGYHGGLSVASKRSLELQGGVFTRDEGGRFLAQPYAEHAVLLRRWDDLAKIKGRETPPLAHFLGIARRAMEVPLAATA